jgi:hypothetical protein
LILTGLAALLALSVLPRLAALLALSALTAWLFLLLHVVSHKTFLLRKRGVSTPSKFIALHNLVAAKASEGWEQFG